MGFWAHGAYMLVDSVRIGGVTSLGLPEQAKSEVEITSHDSAGWREFVGGLRDGGQVAINARIRGADAGQQALISNFQQDNVTAAFEIHVPADPEVASSAFTLSFTGFVLDTGGELPFDDAGERTFTIRIKGQVYDSLVSA